MPAIERDEGKFLGQGGRGDQCIGQIEAVAAMVAAAQETGLARDLGGGRNRHADRDETVQLAALPSRTPA